jgi:hypothetical protein
MIGILKGIGITLGAIIIIVALALGYLGLLPGVSTIFGSDKPMDLGVVYTEQDRLSGRAKAGWEVVDLPPDLPPQESLRYSGRNAVDTTFNEAELTAWANDPWTYFPLSDCQIRVNDDATIEFSGKWQTNLMRPWAEAMGVSDEYSNIVQDYLRWFSVGNPPFYLKMSGSVVGGELMNARVYEARVGRLSVPTDQLEDYLVPYARWQANRIPGFTAETVELLNGAMRFVGTLPSDVARSTD